MWMIPLLIRGGMISLAVGVIVLLIVLLVLKNIKDQLPEMVKKLPAIIPRSILDWLIIKGTRFSEGFRTLRNRRQFVFVFLLSIVAWGVAGIGTIYSISAFNLPVPWFAGLFVLVVVNLGSVIPSSPGFIGVYHYLVVLALSVWIDNKNMALGYAIASHGLNIITYIVLGGFCLWFQGISIKQIRYVPLTK